FQLNYSLADVGKSDVATVEVWRTTDTRKWDKVNEEPPRKPSTVTIKVPTEGRYGFSLIARSGVGLGEAPPAPGALPQGWVQVDMTPPNVRLDRVEVGRGPDTGKMLIRWTAFDPFMASNPITLAYRGNADQPWTPIATKLANTGEYIWTMPAELPYQIFIRV